MSRAMRGKASWLVGCMGAGPSPGSTPSQNPGRDPAGDTVAHALPRCQVPGYQQNAGCERPPGVRSERVGASPRGGSLSVCGGILTRNAAKLTHPSDHGLELLGERIHPGLGRPAWLCYLAYTHDQEGEVGGSGLEPGGAIHSPASQRNRASEFPHSDYESEPDSWGWQTPHNSRPAPARAYRLVVLATRGRGAAAGVGEPATAPPGGRVDPRY